MFIEFWSLNEITFYSYPNWTFVSHCPFQQKYNLCEQFSQFPVLAVLFSNWAQGGSVQAQTKRSTAELSRLNLDSGGPHK